MDVVVAHSINAFARDEWNRLFADELEDFAYHRAVEHAALAGFVWLYLGVRAHGHLRAVVPAFITDYRLDTTLSGTPRQLALVLARALPRLLTLRMVSLGSPVSEVCHLGFDPECSVEERLRIATRLLDELTRFAAREAIGMIAVKDAPAAQDALWSAACTAAGLRRMPGLPGGVLDIHFSSLGEYLQTLSRATRRDMRRKLRARALVRVEWRSRIDDILQNLMHLYRATLDRAEFRFEELGPAYFTEVLRQMPDTARCALYWLGDRLVAFNLVLHDRHCLLDKFFGMDEALGREHNLYYLSWMENVRYCIEHGISHYHSGQGLIAEKRRLGSRLLPNALWYCHRNRAVDRVFAGAERLFRLDRLDDLPSGPAREAAA